jgi:hypothetical protein
MEIKSVLKVLRKNMNNRAKWSSENEDSGYPISVRTQIEDHNQAANANKDHPRWVLLSKN